MCVEAVVWNLLHLGESWRCKKGPERLLHVGKFGRNRAFWFCVTTMGFVSRQDLVLAGCSWVVVVVALYLDNVATKVPLSRPRQSRQEVQVAMKLG